MASSFLSHFDIRCFSNQFYMTFNDCSVKLFVLHSFTFKSFEMFLKAVSYAQQGCIYLIKIQ